MMITVPGLVRRISTAGRLLRNDPMGLLRFIFGSVARYSVFYADSGDIPPAVLPDGFSFRRLTDQELLCHAEDWPDIRETREWFVNPAAGVVYGLFQGTRLAHVAWLVTADQNAARMRSVRLLRLRPGEAEITGCFTPPDFRGRGVYAVSIHQLFSVARARGVSRIFMVTRIENVASRRGIAKAGLREAEGHVSFVRCLAYCHFIWRRLKGIHP
jgi:hypothetical protein